MNEEKENILVKNAQEYFSSGKEELAEAIKEDAEIMAKKTKVKL